MKFFATLALLATSVIAAPLIEERGDWKDWNGKDGCLSRDYIQGLVDQERIFLLHTDVAAAQAIGYKIFAANIVEFGDSINSLRGDALGNQVEYNATTYVTETTSQPPYKAIDSVSTTIECNQFVWQWKFYGVGPPTAKNDHISGFTLGKVDYTSGQIYYQYVEFNSLAWAENVGFTVIPPAQVNGAAAQGTSAAAKL